MEKITSRSNPKVVAAYNLKKAKDELFLIEGFHLVEMAYQANLLKTVFSVKPVSFKDVTTYLCTPEVIEKLASTKTPEGIIGICEKKRNSILRGDNIVFLDNVQDPGNVGTICRTALAMGYKDILYSKGTASLFSSKTLLASQGSLFFLNAKEASKDDLLSLQKEGYKLISTALKDSTSLDSFSLKIDKKVLIFGNEGQGISKEILDISDYKLRIDIENIDSLNVSVAAGIFLNKFKNLSR